MMQISMTVITSQSRVTENLNYHFALLPGGKKWSIHFREIDNTKYLYLTIWEAGGLVIEVGIWRKGQ